MKKQGSMRKWTQGTLRPHQKTCLADQCCLLCWESFRLQFSETGSGAGFYREKETWAWRTVTSICMSSLSRLGPYRRHGDKEPSREKQEKDGGHGRETITDTMQMERCRPSHHGKSRHSWCRTGNDTCLRKLSTMTVHWSFFNIDRLCFCGNRIVCVFGCCYKWQRFPSSMKTSSYLLSGSSTHDCHALSRLLGDRTVRNAVDLEKIVEPPRMCFHQRVAALCWCFSYSGFVWRIITSRHIKPFQSTS